MSTPESHTPQERRDRIDQLLGIDPFLKSIAATIPGWLLLGNVWCFQYVMRSLTGRASLLEIGSFAGLSTLTLLHLKQKFGVTNELVTCDPWAEPEPAPGASAARRADATDEAIKHAFIKNLTTHSPDDLPAAFQMTSDGFFRSWTNRETHTDIFGRTWQLGGAFSFCYIDGRHGYGFVKRDFENIDRLLEPGGFILFDDSAEDSGGGPARVANEVAALARYELVYRAPNALFRKRENV